MNREVAALMGPASQTYNGKLPEDPPGVDALVHITGVGKERALAGMKALMDRSVRSDAILSLGFAGGLREELSTGDLVLSRRLYAAGEDTFIESNSDLLGLAQDALSASGAPRHFVADTLTVPRLVFSAAEKGRLASANGAWVANMEDYWIGRAAIQRGIPFLSVRAVLDTVHQELPPFVAGLGDKGSLRQVLHVAANCIAGPWNMPKVMHLSRQVKVAQNSLTTFGLSYIAGVTETWSRASI